VTTDRLRKRVWMIEHRGQHGRAVAFRVPAGAVHRRIDELRAAGWTLRDIAAAAGVSLGTVHRLAAGGSTCSIITATALLRLWPS
jgi:hypothetical protein